MNFVKAFGLFARLMNHLQRANAEASGDDSIDDFSGVAGAHGVGFDDCKSKISHGSVINRLNAYCRIFRA